MKTTQGNAIPIRPIHESVKINKQILQHKVNNELLASKTHVYSNLTESQKSALKTECISQLKKFKKPSFLSFFCFNKENKKRGVNKSVLKLVSVIKDRCLEEPGVFRKEGDKMESNLIVNLLLNNKKIDFSEYSILTLATALKTYIRDYMDGIFDASLMETSLGLLRQYKYDELRVLCHLFLFSLPFETMTLLTELQTIIFKISNESSKTRMTRESLVNILCLTLTPQSLFKNIEIVEELKVFLGFFIEIDMDSIERVMEYLNKNVS